MTAYQRDIVISENLIEIKIAEKDAVRWINGHNQEQFSFDLLFDVGGMGYLMEQIQSPRSHLFNYHGPIEQFLRATIGPDCHTNGSSTYGYDRYLKMHICIIGEGPSNHVMALLWMLT